MTKKEYHHYSVDELAADPDFQRWVNAPSESDTQFWQEMLTDYPHLQPTITTARQLVLLIQANRRAGQWSAEQQREAHARLMRSVRQDHHLRATRRRWWLSAAATLLLLVSCAWLFWPHSSSAEQLTAYHTGFGETRSIDLPDGSRVILNANSELSLHDNWETGSNRIVQLRGEAYFEIEPKPATGAKFTVVTKDLNVNVLGTIFNVYSRESETSITLEEGKVGLSLSGQPDKLLTKPGERVVYSAREQRLVEETVTPLSQSSWKDGVLILDDVSLATLGRIIEETFGKKVVFQNEAIRQKAMTTKLPGAHDLNLLIETTEAAFGIRIIQTNDQLRFEER